MAKFVKFKINNATAPGAGGNWGGRDVLIGVDDIENVSDVVSGAGAYSVVVTLKSFVGLSDAAIANATIGGRILTLTVSTSLSAAVNPTAVTVDGNMPSQSIVRAMTANPGGIAASAQLGLDGGGVRSTDEQMYWSGAVFSSVNDI
jgi:hypothetical protein